MISNLAYINKNLYIFNQIKFKPIFLILDLIIISLYIRSFCNLVNVLFFTNFIIKFIILKNLTFV